MDYNFIFPDDVREETHSDGLQRSQKSSGLLERLREELPPTFSRQYVCSKLGGLMTPKTLSNLDAKGEGPSARIFIGRHVGYVREDFLDWLEKRLKNR